MTNYSVTASGDMEPTAELEPTNTNQQSAEGKVRALKQRFGKEYEGQLQERYNEVRRLSLKADTIVMQVVAAHSDTLDRFVDGIDSMLERIQTGEQFEDKELWRMVIRLPVLMYRLTEVMDKAAIESDIAKAVSKNTTAVHYLQSTAKTIPAKKAEADILTAEDDDVVELTKHVYQRLRHKLDMAEKLFDAIRKVMTGRDMEKSVFGKENRGPLRRSV